MAEEPEVPEGTGDPPKDPPADPPKEGSDEPKGAGSISLDALPEDLRDRPEAEVKFLLEHMISSLGDRNNQVEDLRKELSEMRGAISATPPPEPDPDDEKPMEELILEDVDKALDRWARKRGYVAAVGELSERVGEAEFSMVAGQVDDFGEHEDAVRKMLKEGKLPATKTNIMGAYTMVLGAQVVEARARDVRGQTGSIPPTKTTPPDPEKAPEMSDLETEVMRAHGMSDPKEWAKYRDDSAFDALKLPT